MTKRLIDLNPQFLSSGGEGVSQLDPATGKYVPAPERRGVGVVCDCPCGCDQQLYVPFANPLDGGPSVESKGWQRAGDTFETLTLTPSILRKGKNSCGWHGFFTSGEVLTV